MDINIKELVEKITDQVIAQMKQEQKPLFCEKGTTALVVFTEEEQDDREKVKVIEQLSLEYDSLLAAGVEVAKPNVAVVRSSQKNSISAILQKVQIILIPQLSVISAAKIANLNGDTFALFLVISGLLEGKKIIANPCLLNSQLTKLPSPLAGKIKEIIAQLQAYGIQLAVKCQTCSSCSSTATTKLPFPKDDAKCPLTTTKECAGCGLCINENQPAVQQVIEVGASRVAAPLGIGEIKNKDLAKYIDHTLLKPDTTKEQVIKLCEEAKKYTFASVCINPAFVPLSAKLLKDSPVKVCTVIGFPLGATTAVTKAIETRDAIANGADEIDMVINVGALKAGDLELVKKDIEGVVQASNGRIVKVILETALLTDDEKVTACLLSKEAGADFVKTSTGFGPGGATAKDIALMRKTVGSYMGVKASGGIRDTKTAEEMIAAGATRIGASASVGIVKGTADDRKGY